MSAGAARDPPLVGAAARDPPQMVPPSPFSPFSPPLYQFLPQIPDPMDSLSPFLPVPVSLSGYSERFSAGRRNFLALTVDGQRLSLLDVDRLMGIRNKFLKLRREEAVAIVPALIAKVGDDIEKLKQSRQVVGGEG